MVRRARIWVSPLSLANLLLNLSLDLLICKVRMPTSAQPPLPGEIICVAMPDTLYKLSCSPSTQQQAVLKIPLFPTTCTLLAQGALDWSCVRVESPGGRILPSACSHEVEKVEEKGWPGPGSPIFSCFIYKACRQILRKEIDFHLYWCVKIAATPHITK